MKTRLILHTCPRLPAALTCPQKYHRSLGCLPAACTLVYYREHKAAFPLLRTVINQVDFVSWCWIWSSPTLTKVQRYFLTNAFTKSVRLIEVWKSRDYQEREIPLYYAIWNAFSRYIRWLCDGSGYEMARRDGRVRAKEQHKRREQEFMFKSVYINTTCLITNA